MHILERYCIALRHQAPLRKAEWLWDRLRPLYDGTIGCLAKKGLERVINGTDPILVAPRFRGISEKYEPEVWKHVMSEIRPGDVVADIGAFLGLYTLALAKRVGPEGKVLALEPDSENFQALKAHIALNNLSDRIGLFQAAAGDFDGMTSFETTGGSESHINTFSVGGKGQVRCVRLDTLFTGKQVDIIKIDVEGFEERVLRGAIHLLSSGGNSPRLLYIEVHPYAWSTIGTTDQSLLDLLQECDYKVLTLEDQPVHQIKSYGEIVAYKNYP